MTLIDFLSRIKVDKSSPHETIHIFFVLHEILQKLYYIHIRSGAQNTGIIVGKVHGHDEPVPYETRKSS